MIGRFADLAGFIRAKPPGLGAVRVVAVDGPSGSGKTTFTAKLYRALTASGAKTAVVPVDELPAETEAVSVWYWLKTCVCDPLERGSPGQYRRYYRWGRTGPMADHPVKVPVPEVLIVDGVYCSMFTTAVKKALTVVVTAPEPLRLARLIAVHGEAGRPRVQRWIADENEKFAPARIQTAADLVIDGAPATDHDSQLQYVAVDGLLVRARVKITGEETG